MRIHYTYKGDGWVDGTVLVGGIKEYYAGSTKCMRRLTGIPHQNVLNALTRIKPYENTLHVHEA